MRKLILVSALVMALAAFTVGASAEVLYEDHFDSMVFGYNGEYVEYGKSDFGEAFWFPNNGFLESGNSDAPHELFEWWTGDHSWSDVAVSTGIKVSQGSGAVGIGLRASWSGSDYYEFRFSSGGLADQPHYEKSSGVWAPANTPSYRILKHVNGRTTLLAEVVSSKVVTLPGMHNGGTHQGQVLEFKFEAIGSRLNAYVKIDDEWQPVLSAQDHELVAGQVGFVHWEYEPVFDYIKVESSR